MSKIKSEFRSKCKALRKEYGFNSACEDAFLKSRFYKDFDTFLIYASYGSEADTFTLIEKAPIDDTTVFLPKVFGDKMKFYRVFDLKNLVEGSFGVREPAEGEEYAGQKAVCVTPGLSFDKKGNRLGYGKGYYDEFLSEYPDIIKIGFCSACCFFDEIPSEETDVKMDFIFADNKLIGI